MTTDPVLTPANSFTSVQSSVATSTLTATIQSPTKSPARDPSPLRDHSPVHLATMPSKTETPTLAPSVAAESGSPSKSSSYSPTKTLHSPMQKPQSPLKSTNSNNVHRSPSAMPSATLHSVVSISSDTAGTSAHHSQVSTISGSMDASMVQSEVSAHTETIQESSVTESKMQDESISASHEIGSEQVDQGDESGSVPVKSPAKRARTSNNGTTPARKKSTGSASTPRNRTSIASSSLVRADSFNSGDIVFARIKGHPWWPARLLEDKQVPEQFLKERRNVKERCLMFYNTHQFGFLMDESLVPFAPNVDTLASNAGVKKAINVAESNPDSIYDRLESIKKTSTEDEIEYDEDEYSASGNRRMSSSKSRKTSVASRKSATPKPNNKRRASEPGEDVMPQSSKRSKTAEQMPSTPARVSKRKSGIAADVPSEAVTEMLMRWRHSLQKTFIKDKSIDDKPRISPETIHTVDFPGIIAVLEEFHSYIVGDFYSAEDVAKTKLHKVVRMIVASPAMVDADPLLIEHDIPARVNRLAEALRFRMDTAAVTE